MTRTIEAVDLFCGLGGVTEGLKRACEKRGYDLSLAAVNHWPLAVQTHSYNHPYAVHRCEDIEVVRPRDLVPSGHLDLLIAAPSCVHHSNARGGRPKNEQDRASAWCVLRWLSELHVSAVLIENVPEFRTWGPLDRNGHAIKELRGQTFQAFLEAIRKHGFNIEHKLLVCADYGDPTSRKRFFLVAIRQPIAAPWPETTHCNARLLANDPLQLMVDKKPWVPARSFIDLSAETKSVFLRKKPLAKKTMMRVIEGLRKFGGTGALPYLIALRRHMNGQSLDEPLATITASGNHFAVCIPKCYLMDAEELGVHDRMVGRDAPGIDNCLIPFFGERDGQKPRAHSLDEPVPTITGHGAGALVQPCLVNMKGNSDGSSIESPLPTQTTNPHQYVVEPFIMPHEKFQKDGCDSIDQPIRTIDATNGRHIKVCQPIVVDISHGVGAGASESSRVRSIEEPIATITGCHSMMLADPCLVQYNGTSGPQSVEDPLPTITMRDRFGFVQPKIDLSGEDLQKLPKISINGSLYAIDIGLRMLKPSELQKAHSLDNYHILGTVDQRVKQIGNSVPSRTSEALCGAILDALAGANFLEER